MEGYAISRIGLRVVALGAMGALLCGCPRGRPSPTASDAPDRFYTVKRGEFKVAFRLEGQLDAIRNQVLRFDGKRGHGQLKLVDVASDRSNVSSNDVVFRLSDEWFVDQEKDLIRKLQNAEEDYTLAVQDLEMIRADNLTELKSAADALRTAREQCRKYIDEDAPRQKKELLQAAQDKSSAYDDALVALDDAKKALADAVSQESETVTAAQKKVTESETALTRAKQEMEKAWYQLRIFKRYDYPEKVSSLEEAVMKSQLAVQRTIVIIPDVSKFKVQVNIPEEYRSRIKTGLSVVIRAKAVPDLTLTGEIVKIAGASTPIIPWDQNSPKVYAADISTDAADERLTPGMTVQVEVVVEKVENVLYVPVEGVYNREGKSYCKVRQGDALAEREVKTGRFSTDFVEIVEGLKDADRVQLDRPTS